MSDNCAFCSEEITNGGILKNPNLRLNETSVKVINFVHGTEYTELCQKCGNALAVETGGALKAERADCAAYVKENIVDFPMMTISHIPANVKYRVKSMITANVTVGTGLFSEMSQSISDTFGQTSTTSGMALKVNSGEMTARTILVRKALEMKANCIVGVDIDYGTTNNNAATINMQGTAIVIENLDEILAGDSAKKAVDLEAKFRRMNEISRWLKADFQTD